MTPHPRRFLALLYASILILGSLSLPSVASGAGKHYCESLNGMVISQSGSAQCTTDATSHAKATGQKAEAIAYNGGTAEAVGRGSYARAGGTGSPAGTARAFGDLSYASADSGGEAIANGKSSRATAHVGYAYAEGTNSSAQAVDWYSVAKASGTGSGAVAVNGGKASAWGVKSFAQAGGAIDSVAEAAGDYSSARATGACYVFAGPGETNACTFP